MTDLRLWRRFFAEEVQTTANVRTKTLVDALASVPRERHLPPGPWIIQGEGDAPTGQRQTPDADPRHVYHCVSVAIDAERQLFNGTPSAVAPLIDALELEADHRVLHIGCGLGYYTALIAHIVGSKGRVLAFEIDTTLAETAKSILAPCPWAEIRCANGAEPLRETFDAILVHAGVTHPLDAWLDELAVGGRMVVPLTVSMPKMGPIGKGLALQITRKAEETFEATPLNLLAIYTAVGVRDESLNPVVGAALTKWPYVPVRRLRRDRHEPAPSCWLHGRTFCLGT